MTAHLEQPLVRNRNTLWCATFQLAWNATCDLFGEDLHFDSDPPMVAPLNQRRVTWADVDRKSCVALAGFVGDGIIGRIDAELAETFHGDAAPRLVSPVGPLAPPDVVAYAYLEKELHFPVPFERLDHALDFCGTRVAAFGVGDYNSGQARMVEQVTILDYQGQDDFVIELNTESPDDQLLLAKMEPGSTLEATIRQVLGRVDDASPTPMNVGEVLQVPKMDFAIRRDYDEIVGRTLVLENPDVAPDRVVCAACQDIRFKMDEAGVKLRSESNLTFGCSAPVEPLPTHRLVFDRPFLLMLKRHAAEQPYFAVWIENAELLVGE